MAEPVTVEDMLDLAGAASLYQYPVQEVIQFAISNGSKPFAELTKVERASLAKYARCRFCCELYIQVKARAAGKTVVYVRDGAILEPVPVEENESSLDIPSQESTDGEIFEDHRPDLPPHRL